MKTALVTGIILGLSLCGCERIPTNPRGTTASVLADGLRVGYCQQEPWTCGDDGDHGIEGQLIEAWAAARGVKVNWVEATEWELIEGLETGRFDIAIAGFTDETPWYDRVAMTQPYYEDARGGHVMLLPQGENLWLLEWDRYLAESRIELASHRSQGIVE